MVMLRLHDIDNEIVEGISDNGLKILLKSEPVTHVSVIRPSLVGVSYRSLVYGPKQRDLCNVQRRVP